MKEATRYLMEHTIPEFAEWLEEQFGSSEAGSMNPHTAIDVEAQLTELIHRNGYFINQ